MSNIVRPLETIETEINFYKQQTATGIIEIGKRLKEAKAQLHHGEWGNWLEEKVDFSQRTANQFMKVADEFLNSQSIANLGTRKLFLLLDVPSEDRQQFLSQPHEVNGAKKTVDEMSTRELQRVIKEKQEAEQKAKQAEETAKKALSDAETVQIAWEEERKIRNNLEDKLKELKEKPPVEKIVEKQVDKLPDDYFTLKSEVSRLKQQSLKFMEEAKQAKNEAQSYKDYIETFKGGAKSFESTNLVDFKYAVRDFLKEVTPLVYLGAEFASMTESEREKYLEEVETMERWIDDFKQAVSGSVGGANLIILEGGK